MHTLDTLYYITKATRTQHYGVEFTEEQVKTMLKDGETIIGLRLDNKDNIQVDYSDYIKPDYDYIGKYFEFNHSYKKGDTYFALYSSESVALINIDTEKIDYIVPVLEYAEPSNISITDSDINVYYLLEEDNKKFCVHYDLYNGVANIADFVTVTTFNDDTEILVDLPISAVQAEQILDSLGIENAEVEEDNPFKFINKHLCRQYIVDGQKYLVDKDMVLKYTYYTNILKIIYQKES
jgi:hypothetical protein